VSDAGSVSVSASVVVTSSAASSVTSSFTASGTGAVRPDVSTAAETAETAADDDAVGLVDAATQAKATAPSTARGKMGFMKAKGETSTSPAGQAFHQDALKSLKFTFGRSGVRGRGWSGS
jgi:hypothetical protein